MFRRPNRWQVWIYRLVKSEGGSGPNGIQVNLVGQVDKELRNEKTVELKENSVDEKNTSYQGPFKLLRTMVKDEFVDVPGTSSIKSTTTNSIYHPQPLSSPSPAASSTLLAAQIQASTSATSVNIAD